jgi:hypothetical protein
VDPRKSVAAFFLVTKENRAGWPGFCSVELRCGYIAARRMLAPKVPPAGLARSVRMQLLASAEKSESRGRYSEANALPIRFIINYTMKMTVTDCHI